MFWVASRLPGGPVVQFDEGETGADYDIICTVKTISKQIESSDSMIVAKELSKNKIISTVMKFNKDGWPATKHEELKQRIYSPYWCTLSSNN